VAAPPLPPAQNAFEEALTAGRFVVTTEEPPPKGADLTGFVARLRRLRGIVDAVNVTEASGAVMTMSPAGAVPALLSLGLHPILQMVCRDRNRIALEAELLAASALGVQTVSCMAGDPIAGGDDPDARPVFDLDTMGLLRAVRTLGGGHDSAGRPLTGAPSFFAGGVANPGAADLDAEVARMEQKVEAGARFFQTQAVYDADRFERFMAKADRLRVPVLAGFIVLKSGDMARRLNATLPDVSVPEPLIHELDVAADEAAASIDLSGRILARLKPACQGLHVIAVGWEARLPAVFAAAGLEASAHGA
jgi:methylenetetrahydrofolate reductase (NADH)